MTVKTNIMETTNAICQIGKMYVQGLISIKEAAAMVNCIDGVTVKNYRSANGIKSFVCDIAGEQVQVNF